MLRLYHTIWYGKRPKGGYGERMWKTKGKTTPSWTRQKWPRPTNGKMENSLELHFRPILWPFFALSRRGPFSIWFLVFPISGFWPFSMPYRHAMIPNKVAYFHGMPDDTFLSCACVETCHSSDAGLRSALGEASTSGSQATTAE